jgi:hypothetical protein
MIVNSEIWKHFYLSYKQEFSDGPEEITELFYSESMYFKHSKISNIFYETKSEIFMQITVA